MQEDERQVAMGIDIDKVPVCVINLPERVERLNRTREELNSFFGCSKEFNLVEGIRDRNPMKGIARSHVSCVAMAKEKGWRNVLVVEDDVKFQAKGSRASADESFREVPDDHGILCAGIYTGQPRRTKYKSWMSISEFSALHFYVVDSSAYDAILGFECDKHIDRWMSTAGIKCYVADPFFAIQHPGHSDNVNRVMNYDNLLSKFNVLR